MPPNAVVLGGGNVKKLDALPAGTQAGDNDKAFRGGLRLWEKSAESESSEITTAGVASDKKAKKRGGVSMRSQERQKLKGGAVT